ncbi:MAG TPA: hypothetical protein VMH35_06425 [Streptosporangiaceae bacterium]|nr:hypothetical protein [Streptosporangiaceae bacterium]
MSFAVLITWFAAVLAGLYMLAVWLIENDVTGRTAAPSRLPVPVVLGHVTLAVIGLVLWVAYLVAHQERLAWASIGMLCGIALLGFTMFARWVPVYREPVTAAGRPGSGYPGPAESNFPVAVVAAHGMFAVSTLVLAVVATVTTG